MSRVLGAVLAGGRSRRFGSDKAMALLDGEPLIQRVIARLAPQVEHILICGRAMPGWKCVPDRPAPGLGPLAGLAAALHEACQGGYAAVLSVPCDAPLIPPDLRARLEVAGDSVYLAASPVIGLWPAGLAAMIDAHLAVDIGRSMRGWADRAGAVALDLPLANVNTPEDLAALRGG